MAEAGYSEIIRSYSTDVDRLVKKYDSYDRSSMFPQLEAYLTDQVKNIIEVGAGSGIDAYHFATMGKTVTAVEPSDLILHAQKKYTHANITYIRDRLPDLNLCHGLEYSFDMVFLNRVFMHVKPADQSTALTRLLSFLNQNGVMYMITRHGPSYDGRPMLPVDLNQLADHARGLGYQFKFIADTPDTDGRSDIHFSTVVIRR